MADRGAADPDILLRRVLVAPFLVVAAVTGLAFVFPPQPDSLVYRHEFTVDNIGDTAAVGPAGRRRPRRPPRRAPSFVIPPSDERATIRVVFFVEVLGDEQHHVRRPNIKQVRGTLITSWGETPLMTWFDDLHRNLHLGVVGRHYSALAAS